MDRADHKEKKESRANRDRQDHREPGVVDMDTAMEFTEAGTRANINSNESLKTILGKIKKYFTDLKPHAFKAPANNFTTTDATTAAAAPTVKQLKEDYDALNSALTETENYCVNEHHAMYIRIKGYTKELIMLNTNGFMATDDVNYGTVPEKYRPINPVNCWINLNGVAKAHLSISTNGIIRIYEATANTPVGSHVAINHTFL